MSKLTKKDIINIAVATKDGIDKEITENNDHAREGIVTQVFKREGRKIIKHRCTRCGHLWEKDITAPPYDYKSEQTCPECNLKEGLREEVERVDIRFAEGCMILTPIIRTNTVVENTEISPDNEWAELYRIPVVCRRANNISIVISPQGIFCVQTQSYKTLNMNNSYLRLPFCDKAVAAMFKDAAFTEFVQKMIPTKDINGNDLKIETTKLEDFIISVDVAFKTLETQRKNERMNGCDFTKFEPKTSIGAIIDRYENNAYLNALQNEPSGMPHLFHETDAVGNKISGVLYCGHTRTVTTISNEERKHECPACKQSMDLRSFTQKRIMVLEKGPQNSLLIRHFAVTYNIYPEKQTIEATWREKRIYFGEKKIHLVLPNEKFGANLPVVTKVNDIKYLWGDNGFKIIHRTQKPDIEWREHSLNEYENSLLSWCKSDLIQPNDELIDIINSTCMGEKGLVEAWRLNDKTNIVTLPYSISRDSYIYQIYAKPIMKQLLEHELWALLKDVMVTPINTLREKGMNPKATSIQNAFDLTKRGVDFICSNDKDMFDLPCGVVVRVKTVATVLSIEPSADDETIRFFSSEATYLPTRMANSLRDFYEKYNLRPTDIKTYLDSVYKNQCITHTEAFNIWSKYLDLAMSMKLKLTKSKLYPSSLKREYDKLMFAHAAAIRAAKEKN